MTRGYRNNNPLNIKHSSEKFQGEISGNDKVFKSFSNMEYGYRAAFVILASYLKMGYNNIEKIIARWAPFSENDTNSYTKKVEKWSGVKKEKELLKTSGEEYIKIVSAMATVENGTKPDLLQVREGFNLQTKITYL